MTATSYTLHYSPSDARHGDEDHFVHHQALQVGDVIQPKGESRWFRVVNILSHRSATKGLVAQLSQGAETEALAHDPKATPP